MSKEKAKNGARKSKYYIDVEANFETQMMEIIRYRPHKRINYGHLIRFINHEKLHLILDKKINHKTCRALDNLEGTNKEWVVN